MTILDVMTGGASGDGATPVGGLIQGKDADFYGTMGNEGENLSDGFTKPVAALPCSSTRRKLATPTMAKPLKSPDDLHVQAAIGWLELGNPLEADEALGKVSAANRMHPEVLEVRWQIYAKNNDWDACRFVASSITAQDPDRPMGWVYLARATRRATGGGLQLARHILLSVVDWFPEVPVIPYHLAGYNCQLGDLAEAWLWLEKAFAMGDAHELKIKALEDPDLKDLWKKMRKA